MAYYPPACKLKPIQLFIDLDLSSFEKDKAKLDAALYDTLNTVEQYLNGGVATIPYTGGAYHIYLPLDPHFVPVY